METKFYVVCDDYVSMPGSKDQEGAERKKAEIEKAAVCELEHRIVETLPGETRAMLIERLNIGAYDEGRF